MLFFIFKIYQRLKKTCPIPRKKLRQSGFLPALALSALFPLAAGCALLSPDSPPPEERQAAPAAVNSPAPLVRHMLALGTVVTLRAEGEEAAAALDESAARLRALDALFDAANPESDIARLNAAAGGDSIAIAPETRHLLEISQEYSARTGGAWDITIGPLSYLWREAIARQSVPEGKAVQEARALVDWQKLELTPDGHARLLKPGMAVDPGGAAKGLALDEVRRIFSAHHIKNGLISLGESSLCAVGQNPAQKPWQIALRHPRQKPPARLGVLPLTGALLATSGDYEHFFIADGRRYHHIIDPRTGWPAENGTAGAVLALPDTDPSVGLSSDILSTILFILGNDGAALLPPDASALLIAEDGSITVLGAPLPLMP